MSEMMLAVRPDGSAYLMHHGIKGMKWGVRKQPKIVSQHITSAGSAERLNSSLKKFTDWYNSPHKPGSGKRADPRNPYALRPHYELTSVGSTKPQWSVALGNVMNGDFAKRQAQGFYDSIARQGGMSAYYARQIGKTATKLGRAMRTNLYSPQGKVEIGMQLTGQILNNVGSLTFGTAAGQAAVLLGATAIAAAVQLKKGRKVSKSSGQSRLLKQQAEMQQRQQELERQMIDDHMRRMANRIHSQASTLGLQAHMLGTHGI